MNDVLTESVYVGFSEDKSLVCCTIRNGFESFKFEVGLSRIRRLRSDLRNAKTIPARLKLKVYRELEHLEAVLQNTTFEIEDLPEFSNSEDEPTVIDWPLVGLYGLAGVLFTSLTAWVVLNW